MNDDDKARLFKKKFNSTTFQNIQTDAAELVNVGVVDLGHEAHLNTCDFKFKKLFNKSHCYRSRIHQVPSGTTLISINQ